MHFCCLVLVDREVARDEAEAAIEPLMAPHYEEYGGYWDWYVIGGRWTGVLDDDYDPQTAEANTEICKQCQGTGTRDWTGIDVTPEWIEQMNGCNGCKGTGRSVKWPTQWEDFEGDVKRAEDVPRDFTPVAYLTPTGKWHELGWQPDEDELEQYRQDLHKYLDQQLTVVVVDCHI